MPLQPVRRAQLGILLALSVCFVMPGCTYTFAARLYDMETATVAPATFKWNGSGRGPVVMTLPSGEVIRGEYVSVSDDTISWGQIFASGSSGTATATGYALTTQGKQKGTAIGTGDLGTALECEYVTSGSSPQGYGTCRDNRQKIYRLMFGGKAEPTPKQ